MHLQDASWCIIDLKEYAELLPLASEFVVNAWADSNSSDFMKRYCAVVSKRKVLYRISI